MFLEDGDNSAQNAAVLCSPRHCNKIKVSRSDTAAVSLTVKQSQCFKTWTLILLLYCL